MCGGFIIYSKGMRNQERGFYRTYMPFYNKFVILTVLCTISSLIIGKGVYDANNITYLNNPLHMYLVVDMTLGDT